MKEYQKRHRESKTDEQRKNMKEYQKEYNKNMTDEQKKLIKKNIEKIKKY